MLEAHVSHSSSEIDFVRHHAVSLRTTSSGETWACSGDSERNSILRTPADGAESKVSTASASSPPMEAVSAAVSRSDRENTWFSADLITSQMARLRRDHF